MFTKLLQLVKIINGDQRPIDCPLGRKNSDRTYVPRSGLTTGKICNQPLK